MYKKVKDTEHPNISEIMIFFILSP